MICALYVMEKTHLIGLLLHLVGRLVVGEEPAFGMHDNWLEEQSLAMVYPKLFILSNNDHRTVYKKWEVGRWEVDMELGMETTLLCMGEELC